MYFFPLPLPFVSGNQGDETEGWKIYGFAARVVIILLTLVWHCMERLWLLPIPTVKVVSSVHESQFCGATQAKLQLMPVYMYYDTEASIMPTSNGTE